MTRAVPSRLRRGDFSGQDAPGRSVSRPWEGSGLESAISAIWKNSWIRIRTRDVNNIPLFAFALGLGFVSAIPPGGVQIEMAKRAISGRLKAAWLVIAGSVSSDILYGVLALYGLAQFLETKWVFTAFHALGAVLLCLLGFLTIKEARKPKGWSLKFWRSTPRRWDFVTGFSVGISNPTMLLSWLLGVTFAKQLGLASPFPGTSKAVFIAGGALGLGSCHVVLAVILNHLKSSFSKKATARIQLGMGLTLLVLSLYFIYQAVWGGVDG